MEFSIEQAIEILERTPAVLRSLLGGLSSGWIHSDGGQDSWDPHAVIGHLIHGEDTDWMPRAQMILEHGESKPFESFDRLAQFERWSDRPLEELLDLFGRRRQENLARLRSMNITPEDGSRRGTHPELGSVTLNQLLATWAVHDLNHIGQIAEDMSKRYSDAVGPWKAYLEILGR